MLTLLPILCPCAAIPPLAPGGAVLGAGDGDILCTGVLRPLCTIRCSSTCMGAPIPPAPLLPDTPAEDWLGPGAGVADMNGELAADGAADPSLLPAPSWALPLMCIPPPLPGKALWLPVADTGVDMAPGYAYVRDGPPDADDGVDGAVACWYELA